MEVRVTRHVTEEELVLEQAERVRVGRRWRGALGLAASILIGVASMLASRFTFSCGVVILLGVVAVLTGESMARRSARRRRRYLAGDQEHGVSSDEIWLRTAQVELRSSWANLGTWHRSGGLLRLHCYGMPPVLIPEDALVAAGCFDEVMQLARTFGRQRP